MPILTADEMREPRPGMFDMALEGLNAAHRLPETGMQVLGALIDNLLMRGTKEVVKKVNPPFRAPNISAVRLKPWSVPLKSTNLQGQDAALRALKGL